MLSRIDAINFPFLKEASLYIKNTSVEVFNDYSLSKLVDNYLYNVHKNFVPEEKLAVDDAVIRFLGCCIVVNQVNHHSLTLRFAGYESRKVIEKLKYFYNKDKTPKKDNFNIYFDMIYHEVYKAAPIVKIENISDILDVNRYLSSLHKAGLLKLKKSERSMPNTCVLKICDYLELIEHSKLPELAMLNQIGVNNGLVFFDLQTFFIILQEQLKYFLTQKIKNMFGDNYTDLDVLKRRKKYKEPIIIPEHLKAVIKKYQYLDIVASTVRDKKVLDDEIRKGKYDIKSLVQSYNSTIAPCVQVIIEKFARGENPTHFERLLLASYLLKKNKEIDEIVDIFKQAPNYREDVTINSIEYLRDKEYMPASCDKIAAFNCCYRAAVCRNVKNPISV